MNITVKDNPDRSRYEATLTDDGTPMRAGGQTAETAAETAAQATAERAGQSEVGAVAGFADYKVQDGLVVLTHTEVDPAFEGHGVGSMLVRAALDDVREQGRRAVPVCPFVRGWIDRHPDYEDLVKPGSGR